MTPAARIDAAIDLLGRIASANAPADWVMADYVRERRYIGSKDRRAIGDLVYAVLRRRARLDWWLARAGAAPENGVAWPRRAVIAALVMLRDETPETVGALFDGGPHHPAPLGPEERAVANALAGRPLFHPDQPVSVRGELPDWLLPAFREVFGAELEAELGALEAEAPLDLRVNTLKTDRAGAIAALAAEGIDAQPTPLSPVGLRVAGRQPLMAAAAFRDGLVEVQDEGSQLVALLVDAQPGMAVVDYCAGAGGKTLALAARMANSGRLLALDVDQRRLDRAARRVRRAGLGIVRRRVLRGEGWRKLPSKSFDRVLVDAPCSGSGAWRRNPDARWRLTPDALDRYRDMQREILSRAARLVRPGGRLVYATCSLLPAENDRQVEAFLAGRRGFELLPVERVWHETVVAQGGPPVASLGDQGGRLRLSPGRNGTDGFFAAVFQRVASP